MTDRPRTGDCFFDYTTLPATQPHLLRAAMLQAAGHARDVADLAELLAVLGLLPGDAP